MYLAIITLPLLSAISAGLLGRKLGVTGAQLITSGSVIITCFLALIAFYEVGLTISPVSIKLFSWIDSESLTIDWGFNFDALTVSMLIPVLIVSALVHVYSIGYMSEDPHQQRFFSYLSMFTFFMLILVTGDNYLVMFIGWEGELSCLKWLNINNLDSLSLCEIISPFLCPLIKKSNEKSSEVKNELTKLRSYQRIGPHNIDILSILIGSLLGDGHMEKRGQGLGVRVKFEQSSKNVEYLMWFHSYLSTRGYCRLEKPEMKKRIKKDGLVIYHYLVNSYTFTSLNWLHDMFYLHNVQTNKLKKTIPLNLSEFLTPLALAIWFMDDGSKLGQGVKIATNFFSKEEVELLSLIIKKKFNIETSVHIAGKGKGFTLYIPKKSKPLFAEIVKPYMLSSMTYKLN